MIGHISKYVKQQIVLALLRLETLKERASTVGACHCTLTLYSTVFMHVLILIFSIVRY